MKKIWLSLLALSISLPSMAVTAREGIYTITQSDGSTIEVVKIGDERSHIYLTTDGIPVGRTSSSEDLRYLTTSGLSDVKAHNAGDRSQAELTFLHENAADLSGQLILRSREAAGAKKAQRTAPSMKSGEVVNKGKARIPVLLVQYPDKKFLDSNPVATFEKFFKEGASSARQYFEDQSNGQFQPQFDIYGPYTLPESRESYGGNDSWGDDKGVGKMVAQACIGLSGEIDFSKYDNDGDKECDTVIVLYAGEGEASSDVEESVWPCQWSLSSSDYGKALTYNSTLINRFAVFNELNVTSGAAKVEGIGTFCHEFSHCLGLPDFYDTQYSGNFGMACWSLMDSGNYNNDGYTPVGYSAYEKEFMGWLKIDDAAKNTNYTLPISNTGVGTADKAVKITNPADANEYYIIENRAKQGWDKYMPTEGLMITHVTYSASAWNSNTVNNYKPQRMTLVPADGELKLNAYNYYGETYYSPDKQNLLGDLWPYGSADELTDESTPSFSPNSGKTIGMPVIEMTRNDDGTISFWIDKSKLPPVAPPTTSADLNPVINGKDSFTAIWLPSSDADVTYTLNVFEHHDITYESVLSSKFMKDGDYTNDWTTEGSTEFYQYITDAIKFGSTSKTGGVITKSEIPIGDYDCATVVINAKSFNVDANVNMRIAAVSGSTTLSSKDVQITSTASDYVVVLPNITKDFKVRISTVTTKKRAYLYSADIYVGDASAAVAKAKKSPTVTGDNSDMTISGITDTQYVVTGLKPGIDYDYRVKAVPVDETVRSESPWSDIVTVALSSASISDTSFDPMNDEEAVYFNLNGLRVSPSDMTPGIYIKRQGRETIKIYVK